MASMVAHAPEGLRALEVYPFPPHLIPPVMVVTSTGPQRMSISRLVRGELLAGIDTLGSSDGGR